MAAALIKQFLNKFFPRPHTGKDHSECDDSTDCPSHGAFSRLLTGEIGNAEAYAFFKADPRALWMCCGCSLLNRKSFINNFPDGQAVYDEVSNLDLWEYCRCKKPEFAFDFLSIPEHILGKDLVKLLEESDSEADSDSDVTPQKSPPKKIRRCRHRPTATAEREPAALLQKIVAQDYSVGPYRCELITIETGTNRERQVSEHSFLRTLGRGQDFVGMVCGMQFLGRTLVTFQDYAVGRLVDIIEKRLPDRPTENTLKKEYMAKMKF